MTLHSAPTPENIPDQKIVPHLQDNVGTPQIGSDLRLKQKVADAVASIPGGEKLDQYFGLSTGQAQQPPEEAANSEELIKGLRAASTGEANLSDLLEKISEHNQASGVDPDLLRALMRGPNKKDG